MTPGESVREFYREQGRAYELQLIIDLLADYNQCRLDAGHNTKGYCFCNAIELLKAQKS